MSRFQCLLVLPLTFAPVRVVGHRGGVNFAYQMQEFVGRAVRVDVRILI